MQVESEYPLVNTDSNLNTDAKNNIVSFKRVAVAA